jgi:hypothetical protein
LLHSGRPRFANNNDRPQTLQLANFPLHELDFTNFKYFSKVMPQYFDPMGDLDYCEYDDPDHVPEGSIELDLDDEGKGCWIFKDYFYKGWPSRRGSYVDSDWDPELGSDYEENSIGSSACTDASDSDDASDVSVEDGTVDAATAAKSEETEANAIDSNTTNPPAVSNITNDDASTPRARVHWWSDKCQHHFHGEYSDSEDSSSDDDAN